MLIKAVIENESINSRPIELYTYPEIEEFGCVITENISSFVLSLY